MDYMDNFNYSDYDEYSHKITHIILNTTNQCNFRCRMCFCDWHEQCMTPEIADKAIKYALSRKDSSCKKLNVTFFGGEPLLNFPLITYVVSKWKNKCSFSITTNGSLITDEILKFLKDNNVSILLSIDGAKETQDYNRPFKNSDKSTFDVLEPKLPKILEAFPDTTFRSTIIPETVEHLFENYLFAKETGFKNYFCIPDAYSNWTEDKQKELMAQAVLIATEFIRGIAAGENVVLPQFISNGLIYHLNIKSNIPVVDQSVMRCGLGVTGFGVGSHGSIVACQEHGTITAPDDIFIIGDVQNGIDKDKHIFLLNKYLEERALCRKENCQGCQLKDYCINNLCPSRQGFMFKNFNSITKADCLWMQCQYLCAKVIFEYFSNNYSKNFIKLLEFLLGKENQKLIFKKIKIGGG